MCHILSRYFWAVYGVFEQQRLISDFTDVLDASFLLYAEVGSDSVDPIRLRAQKQCYKELHCLTVNLRFC